MDEYLGGIQAFGFNFPPKGWAFCDGQLLAINSNQALYSLLGTTFGGDGRTTFALPDLRGRTIVHPGQGSGLTLVQRGEKGGNEMVTLTMANLPAHNHAISDATARVRTQTMIYTGSGSGINEPDNGSYPFGSGGAFPNIYCEQPPGEDTVGGVTSVSTVSGSTDIAGQSQGVAIRSPFLGVYVSICTSGLYPPRN